MPDRSGRKWLARYTALFLMGILALSCVLLLNHKVPVYTPDGYYQHFTVLGFAGNALRGLLRGQLPPTFSFSLGQGMDVLTSLAHHGLFDPLNLLCVFFGDGQIILAYILLDVLRAYLLGLCFIAYAEKLGVRDGWALSLSAIILVFSGYSIMNIGRHTYFLNGPLYLCLLLLGVENVLRERRWLGYVLTVALMLAVNFYFAYMNTVVAILYIVVRLVARARQEGLRGTARDGFTLLFGYILGALISMAVLLPIVLCFLDNARLGEATGYSGSMLHYGLRHYAGMLLTLFTSAGASGAWSVYNYAPLALFTGLCLLWRRDSQARQVRLALGLCTLALCLPIAGRIMNGNAYVSNRWCYALGVFLALACALALPDLPEKTGPRQRRCIAGAAILYAAVFLVYWLFLSDRNPLLLPGTALTLAFAVLYGTGKLAALSDRNARALITGFLALTVLAQCFVYWQATGQIDELRDAGIAEDYNNETVAGQIENPDFRRIEQPNTSAAHSLLQGYMGTSFYWSLVNGRIGAYYRQLGLSSQHALDRIRDLGGSCELNAVSAVRYYLLPESYGIDIVPYGFERAGERRTVDGSGFLIYENRYALPLGYAYDSALSEADYAALPVERKLQALLARAICDSGFVPQADAPDEAVQVEYALEPGEGAELTPGGVRFRDGGSVRLAFDAPPDCETWLIAGDFTASENGTIFAQSRYGANYLVHKNSTDNFFFSRPFTALCLGGGQEGVDGCTLIAREATACTAKDLRVVSLPLSAFRENAAARRGEALEDVRLSDNRLQGSITVGGNRVLQIAVPWSRGWRAWVDGEPAAIFPCGGMYMGLELREGAHEIEMRYATPGLLPGAVLSLAALALTAVLAIVDRLRRRKKR